MHELITPIPFHLLSRIHSNPSVSFAAEQKKNLPDLVEAIVLQAELAELKASPYVTTTTTNDTKTYRHRQSNN